jgi:hypothetical protein
VVKSEGEKTVGRSRHRWKDNMRCILEKECGGVEIIRLAHGKDKSSSVVSTEMKLQLPHDAEHILIS